jgi:hypothetical protein
MTEEEEKQFWAEFLREEERGKIQKELFGKQIISSTLRIPFEGFVANDDKILISDDLEIHRFEEVVRDEFFQRASGLELRDYKQENNWFFLKYTFEDERRRIGGMETGDRILTVAIFFALATNKLFRINKSQGFIPIDGKLQSIGITRIPNAPWAFDNNANLDDKEIEKIKLLWPLFRTAYSRRDHFALVTRRYYFSLIRNQWEDQIIDLIIALEALLIPEMDEINKGGKIAKRLSRILKDRHKRGVVTQIALKCYEIRNKIVHGKNYFIEIRQPDPFVQQLREYVKEALQVYLIDYDNLSIQQLADKLDDLKGEQI